MPPVDETTFIAKADALINKLEILAEAINDARLLYASEALQTRQVLAHSVGELIARADQAIEEARTAAREANDIEIARIKRVPVRHGGRADGAL